MIGLLLIYFIGRLFYNLALEHSKSVWGFAILGVISYYAGTFLGGLIIALFYSLALNEDIETVSDLFISILALPFGILCCWLFYRFLQKRWQKTIIAGTDPEMLDDNLIR